MKKNFFVFLISIFFLFIINKELKTEYIVNLVGSWEGVNRSFSTEKGYRTWKKKNNYF